MTTRQRRQEKPIIVTYHALAHAMRHVHMYMKPELDRLHDVWKMGAPVPSSRILQPKIYEPRMAQAHLGNHEMRIVFPKKLAEWINDVLQRRGLPSTLEQTMKLVRRISKSWG